MPKRKVLSVKDKVAIIKDLENGEKNVAVCKKYGLSSSTVSTLFKNKKTLLQAFESNITASKRLKTCKKVDLDQTLLNWFIVQRNSGLPVNGSIVKFQAEKFAILLGYEDFRCSNGWLQRFKIRHNIVFGETSGMNKTELKCDSIFEKTAATMTSTMQTKIKTSRMACSAFENVAGPTVVYVMSAIHHLPETLLQMAPHNVEFRFIPIQEKVNDCEKLSDIQMETTSEAEVLVADPLLINKFLPVLKNVKWVHSTWAGIESIMDAVEEIKIKPEFILTRHAGEAFAMLMAEYIICQILNWERNMQSLWENQKVKQWQSVKYRPLASLIVCILGVGNMGQTVSKVLKQFGAEVHGFSRTQKDMSQYPHFDIISQNLEQLLPNCDYIINLLPHTQETKDMLTNTELKVCRKKPVFINVGRNSIITEESLLSALRQEWISGAILDVFEKEPLPSSSCLWNEPKVIITPHTAANSTPEHIAEHFLKNLKLFITGSKLLNEVNWSAGY